MRIFLSAGWIVNQSFRALECLFSLLTRCVCLSGKDPVCGQDTVGVKVHYFTHKVSTTTDLYKKKKKEPGKMYYNFISVADICPLIEER